MADEGIWSAAVKRPLDVNSLGATNIPGVDPEDMPVIRALCKVWRDRYPYNLIRSGYYFAHYGFKDFGISIPDRIKANVSACIGWPSKAVRALADLSVFDGWTIDGFDPYGVADLTDSTALELAIPQAIVSAYMHGCAFLTITKDDEGIIITPRSAEYSAAIWDGRHNRLAAVLTINDATSKGRITAFNVFLPNKVYAVARSSRGGWEAERIITNWPEPTAIPFISDPQLSRPLGRARITRPLMSLTDMGFRTLVRMEASAEFYSVPKLWFLGAPEDAFNQDTWSSLVSAINAIDGDIDGRNPELHQISQASMQPHSDMLKTIALVVASETNLPADNLGITLDNPTSAEAMAAAERKLTREADRQNRLFGSQLQKLLRMTICLRDGLTAPPDDLKDIKPVWMPTREISDAARADAYVKISGVNETYANSTVGLRRLGLTNDEIVSLKNEATQSQARSVLDMLVNGGAGGDGDTNGRSPSGQGPEPDGEAGATGTGTTVDGTGRTAARTAA
ncbi:phage portal protein [Bifidobacterium amazonense]|uniref:Phage portal protein n=1 Tax=Bifidobacterium amazonense TaxID=2809027 RepID=A0ABS9VU95_9BIFI|nr:phage portal protein [Bifidobacterium amazonense]MCH9275667.1 phage portal protein [Bifidobacterium amazonense]